MASEHRRHRLAQLRRDESWHHVCQLPGRSLAVELDAHQIQELQGLVTALGSTRVRPRAGTASSTTEYHDHRHHQARRRSTAERQPRASFHAANVADVDAIEYPTQDDINGGAVSSRAEH